MPRIVIPLKGHRGPILARRGRGRAEPTELLWPIKVAFCSLFLTQDFLKFMCAGQVLAQCFVVTAAVPYRASDPQSLPSAMQAAEFHIRAASNFNRSV